MKLNHERTGKQDRANERARRSVFTKYLIMGAAAFTIGTTVPSCGSGNPDDVIHIPPLGSDGGATSDGGPVSDGGAGGDGGVITDGGACISPTPVCAPQSVNNQTLNVGDTLVVEGYKFRLTGTSEVDGNQVATFDVLDSCDNVLLSGQSVGKGTTRTFHVDGTNIDIVVSVPSVTVLDPKTATVNATVSCPNDGGVTTDGGTTSDGGAGGTDSGSGGSDGGSGGTDGGVISDGGSTSDGGAGGADGGSMSDGGSVSDGGSTSDGGSGGTDGGVITDGGSDGGVISDGGSGGTDGGVITDGGSEAGADGGVISDGGSVSDGGACGGATTGSFFGPVSLTTPRSAGGYTFHYDGLSGSDALFDITCGGISDAVSLHCPVGVTSVLDVPSDGKEIRVYVFAATTTYANVSINVVNH